MLLGISMPRVQARARGAADHLNVIAQVTVAQITFAVVYVVMAFGVADRFVRRRAGGSVT